MVSEYFKGTQLYKTLMIGSMYVFLIIMMFVMAFDRFMVIPVMIVLGVWMLFLWIAHREQVIKILRKNAGKKVLVGPVDQEEDMGEIVELKVKRIVPFEDLGEDQKKVLNTLTDREKELINSFEKSDNLRYILLDEPKEIEKELKRLENKSNK